MRESPAFPRAQLWSWHASMGNTNTITGVASGSSNNHGAVSPRGGMAKDELVESMLREVAMPVDVSHDGRMHPPSSPNSFTSSQRPIASPVSMTSFSSSSSLLSPPSSSSSSRRHLGKKTESHMSLRPSSRNLTPGGSSRPQEGRENGWKAYKIAHRTHKFMAKARKVIEVLSKDQQHGSSRKLSDGAEHEDDEPGDYGTTLASELCGSNPDAIHGFDAAQPPGSSFDGPLTPQQLFERDVLDDSDGDDDGDGHSVRLRTPGSPSRGEDETFWDIYKEAATCQRPGSARGRYIAHCEAASMLVLPVLDLQKPSRYQSETKTLRYDNYYFGDQRAEALGDALHLLPVQVNELSMRNAGISGVGSSAIVQGLSLRQLHHLNFAENRIGARGVGKIFQSLQDPHVNLRTLDLGDNHLGDQCVRTLVQCLLNRCTLEHLDLRRNQIFHSAKAIGELLRITTPLRTLNLSWNNIRGEPAQYLARCMMENITLVELDLSDNTLGNNGNADAELGACLATNKSLRRLNVSNNHIHGRSLLIYVNGLQHNSILETLVVRGNPIGSLGAEALLRSVASGSIAKCKVDIGECNVEIQDSNQQGSIYGGGQYTLNLADRSDTILLRELLLLYWKNKSEITDALLNGNPYVFNKKDEKTLLHSLPAHGVLQLKVQPNYDRHEDMIPSAGFEKVVLTLQQSFGHITHGEEYAKLSCIRLLAEEYCFSVDQANALLALFPTNSSQVEKANAAAVLIPQIVQSPQQSVERREVVFDCASMPTPEEFFEDKDKDGKIDVCGDICMVIGLKNLSDIEQAHVEAKVGKWISFNVHNATGKYRLTMSNQIDRRILMRLLEVNKGERKLRQQLKLVDVSQHGIVAQPQQGGFRNVKLNHLPVAMGAAWQFPRVGVLEFDFVATRRPYAICTALTDAAFEKFLKEFKHLDVGLEMKLVGLRSISSLYYFTSSQAQRLMEHFGTFERDPSTGVLMRAEVFVILFGRITDEWNVSETLALLDRPTKHQVLDRLGHMNVFHPMQHMETYEQLQLAVFDQRQFVLLLVKLALSNEAELTHVVLNDAKAVEPEEWKTWTSEDKLPVQGSISCAVRATQIVQSEAQLPPTSLRKKLMQTLLLKMENKEHELALLQ